MLTRVAEAAERALRAVERTPGLLAEEAVSDAHALLRELVGRDFDVDKDGVARLHRGTRQDRIPSTVDTEIRHGRKSQHRRFDGYKLAALPIFRINGLAFSDATQLIAFAGFLARFFFLTLYMQNVLGDSPIQTGAAYLPVTAGVAMAAAAANRRSAGIGARLTPVGRPVTSGVAISSGWWRRNERWHDQGPPQLRRG
jgi:hypothetical protein